MAPSGDRLEVQGDMNRFTGPLGLGCTLIGVLLAVS
jgi:hypothetical protein